MMNVLKIIYVLCFTRPRCQVSVYRTIGPLVILSGNDDIHESSEEFEFRPDWTTHCGVSCP